MSKIEKLSKSQEEKIPVYLKKWLDLGYRTKTTDQNKAKKAIYFLYEKILKTEKPKYIIFLDSPMACELACNLIKNTKFDFKQLNSQLSSQLNSQLGSQLSSQLDSQLDSQLYSQLGSQLYSQLNSQLSSQLNSQLSSQLNSQLGSQLYSQLNSQLSSQLRSQLGSQLRSQLDSQLDSQLYSQLRSQLGSQLYSQLDSQLSSQLRSQLDSQLSSQLRSQLGSQLRSQLRSQLYSQKLEYFYMGYSLWYYGGYYGFYDYILNELFPKKKKEFRLYTEFCDLWQELHQFWLFKEIAFVSDFPKDINLNESKQLHHFDKPAILYRDTYAMYRSNGIAMKPEYITTPKEKITKEMFLKEDNADQSREIIRKIGIERLTEIIKPKLIDKFKTETGGLYELLNINYDKRGERPYLKFKCTSSNETFILGVKPGITKAQDAWSFLNNGIKLEETKIIWEA